MRIDTDHTRFRQIVRGRIRKELRRFMSQGELIGRQGKDLVSIPLPRIDIPHFALSPSRRPASAREGRWDLCCARRGRGDGEGQAGEDPGRHIMEVDVPIEELAEILGEELALPRIKPKGKDQVESEKERYTGISRTGPESLRHFKRTYRAALKRQIAAGVYDPSDPRVVPIREDKRYRTKRVVVKKETNAAIIYMMDVSGSMGEDQKKIVRSEAFWIDAWLRHQYGGIVVRYIVHDAEAREVDQETFYRTRGRRTALSPTGSPSRWSRSPIPRTRGTSISSTSPTATTGRRAIRTSASSCFGPSSSTGSTCSGTARSRAPTARGSSFTMSKRRSAKTSGS
jgi:uncharacterized sporulation protein YeaH/YhbH (DUF444 family)